MAALPVLPAKEHGDFSVEGSYIGPMDAIDDILDDIVDGRSARSKIDRLKRGGTNVVRFKGEDTERPQQREKRQVTAFDNAASDLVAEMREESRAERRLPGKAKSPDAKLDRFLDSVFGDPTAAASSSSAPALRNPSNFGPGDMQAAERRGQLVTAVNAETQMLHTQIADFLRYTKAVSEDFPNIQTVDDVTALVHTDPFGHLQFKAHQEATQRMWLALDSAYQRVMGLRQAAFSELAAHEDATFRRLNPDWTDEDAADLVNMLWKIGVSQTELERLYHSPALLDLGDSRALTLIEDACRYNTGKNLTGAQEIWPAVVDTFAAAGFSNADINALCSGSGISIRDHRIQQLLVWALEWRRGEK